MPDPTPDDLAAIRKRHKSVSAKTSTGWLEHWYARDVGWLLAEVDRLTAESDGRRRALEQVGQERAAEWRRAENAEAEVDSLNHILQEVIDALRHKGTACAAPGLIRCAELIQAAKEKKIDVK